LFWRFSKEVVRLLFAWRLLEGWLESVAAPVDRDNLGMMEQAVENGAGSGHITEQLAPWKIFRISSVVRLVLWLGLGKLVRRDLVYIRK
jgi:hypothetical protein